MKQKSPRAFGAAENPSKERLRRVLHTAALDYLYKQYSRPGHRIGATVALPAMRPDRELSILYPPQWSRVKPGSFYFVEKDEAVYNEGRKYLEAYLQRLQRLPEKCKGRIPKVFMIHGDVFDLLGKNDKWVITEGQEVRHLSGFHRKNRISILDLDVWCSRLSMEDVDRVVQAIRSLELKKGLRTRFVLRITSCRRTEKNTEWPPSLKEISRALDRIYVFAHDPDAQIYRGGNGTGCPMGINQWYLQRV